MEIELKEVSLDSSPSYEALSYTWDGQQPDRHITCKAGTLQVTQNCERALFRLRDSTKRWLWIDSICINQASTAEKNTQIPLMGEIYGKAENVLVWLGPGSKASDETFQYLEDISNLAAPILASQTWRATMNSKDVQEVQIMQQISIPDSIRKTVLSRKTGFEEENKRLYGRSGTATSNRMADVFSRSWFSRMWTVQEAVLSFKTLIVCGACKLRLSDMFGALAILAAVEQLEYKSSVNAMVFFQKLEIYTKLRHHVHSQLAFVPRPRDSVMARIVATTRGKKSFDPRDKVYGLYGYFAALGVQNLPSVDYNSPVSHVYRTFAKFASLNDQSLAILYELEHPSSMDDLPSWVPDWSRPKINWKVLWENFSACGGTQFRFVFSENELHLPAVIIDTVNKRAEAAETQPMWPMDGGTVTAELYLPWMVKSVRTWRAWFSLANELQTYPTRESFFDFFPRTILQNGHTMESTELGNFGDWFQIMMAYHPNYPHDPEVIKLIDELVEVALNLSTINGLFFRGDFDPLPVIESLEWRIIIALQISTPLRNLNHWLFAMSAEATIFTTQDGYLGICSDELHVDDKVILIMGLKSPMIVRSRGDGTWKFVSPAYVHGIMNGEKWPTNQEEMSYFIFK